MLLASAGSLVTRSASKDCLATPLTLGRASRPPPLLKAPSGIAADIGLFSFDSGIPSAVAKKQRKRTGETPLLLFWQRNKLPSEQWLTKWYAADIDCAPPDHYTSRAFKKVFDKWLDSIKVDDGQALRKQIKRRRLASFGVDTEGATAILADRIGATASALAHGRPPVLQTRQQHKAVMPPKTSVAADSPPAETITADCQKQARRKLSANRPPIISTQPQKACEPDPLSPTLVPIDDGPIAIPRTPGKSGLGLKNAFGLPSTHMDFDEDGFGPPKRTGWVPASTGGTWQLNPECLDWLHEPEEGVYFHTESNTMWKEDQYHGVTGDEYVRIEPVLAGSVLADGYVKRKSSLRGNNQEKLCADEPVCVDAYVPSTGWEPIADAALSNPWYRHPSCQGWLRELEQDVYFHEETETLWLPDGSVAIDKGKIALQPLDALHGQQPPAGTSVAPSPSSPRFASLPTRYWEGG